MPDPDRGRQRPGGGPAPTAPLRILLLAPAASAHTRRWADDLVARGHTVSVCSWHDPGPRPAGWRVATAPAAGSWWPWRAVRAVGWLRREARRARPDVIHVHSLGIHGAMSLALPARTAPRLITPWGSELRAANRHPGRTLVAWLALRRAARVVPTSHEVARHVERRYRIPRARITTLSWGVPDALLDAQNDTGPGPVRARYGIPAGATVALSIRSTAEVYRTHEIAAAFTRAARVRSDLFLVVLAGHRPADAEARRAQHHYLARVRKRMAEQAGRAILIEQPLSHAEMFGLMRASHFAISVPRSDQRSSSVLEAAAAGCRLLLSDIAPYRELAADGLLTDPLHDPLEATLADALTHAQPLTADDRRANRELIGQTERGSVKIAQLERLYRDLARPST
ncbi:glycosyltransferase family 4 protein [Kitasatospora sp. NPDC051914]|uniref:glycosyltransferase family 4 protein n=1 Tax=Kitasatospora sp. NPDC051914 TaxID=3154945 RepID=UPI00343A058C